MNLYNPALDIVKASFDKLNTLESLLKVCAKLAVAVLVDGKSPFALSVKVTASQLA